MKIEIDYETMDGVTRQTLLISLGDLLRELRDLESRRAADPSQIIEDEIAYVTKIADATRVVLSYFMSERDYEEAMAQTYAEQSYLL